MEESKSMAKKLKKSKKITAKKALRAKLY